MNDYWFKAINKVKTSSELMKSKHILLTTVTSTYKIYVRLYLIIKFQRLIDTPTPKDSKIFKFKWIDVIASNI